MAVDLEHRAIEKLIRDVNSVERIRTAVPRRIFMLFAVVFALSVALLVFAVVSARRQRPLRSTRP